MTEFSLTKAQRWQVKDGADLLDATSTLWRILGRPESVDLLPRLAAALGFTFRTVSARDLNSSQVYPAYFATTPPAGAPRGNPPLSWSKTAGLLVLSRAGRCLACEQPTGERFCDTCGEINGLRKRLSRAEERWPDLKEALDDFQFPVTMPGRCRSCNAKLSRYNQPGATLCRACQLS